MVFTPNHFKDLGSRDAVASALKRHKQSELILQFARGACDTLKSILSWGPSSRPPTTECVGSQGFHAIAVLPPTLNGLALSDYLDSVF